MPRWTRKLRNGRRKSIKRGKVNDGGERLKTRIESSLGIKWMPIILIISRRIIC
jgi:hypothetical protein